LRKGLDRFSQGDPSGKSVQKRTRLRIDGYSLNLRSIVDETYSIYELFVFETDGRNMAWFSIVFIGSLAFIILRRTWKESDPDPILWKWFIRSIWLGSIGFFQALEIDRYLEGLSYRPFFGLYAGILLAAVAWFSVSRYARIGHR
jgi:hypothetical protein